MRAEDILWGGNNKCGISLETDISMPEGALANIEYDYIQEQYRLTYNGESSMLVLSDGSRNLLDNIFLSGKKPATEYSGVWVPAIRDRIPANRAMIPMRFQ